MFTLAESPEPEPRRKLSPGECAEVEAALANGRRQPRDKKLVNVYSQAVVQVWMKLDPDDGLKPVEVDPDSDVGEIPEWYNDEHSEMGLSGILDTGYRCSSPDADGNTWSESGLRWGLEEGVAPGQPFLVELPHPYYSKSQTENGTEYDTEYAPEIIQVLKWTPKRIAQAWGRELKAELRFRHAEATRRRKLKSVQNHDVKSMFLASGVYFAAGQSTYDDMEMPRGVYVHLQTTASLDKKQPHWATATLARGEDDNGDWDKAIEDLISKVRVVLPHLTAEQLRSMPRRSSGW